MRSEFISWIRFPLILGVVLIHSGISPNGEGYSELAAVVRLFTKCIPAFCVPMFMAIAGYLFFNNVDHFTIQTYITKLKKRALSLLVPYVFWNSAVIAFFWLIHRYMPQMINPDFENVATFSPLQLLDCFWGVDRGEPIAFQFWFIKILICCVIISPLFYLLLKKNSITIIVLSIAYALDLLGAWWIVYFFALGAWISINKVDYEYFCFKFRMVFLVIAGLSLIALFLNVDICTRQIYILSSMIALVGYGSQLVKSIRLPKILEDSSFFIFCFHAIPLLILEKIAVSILSGKSEWLLILDYFANPIAIISLSVVLYGFCREYLPKFTSLITVGR